MSAAASNWRHFKWVKCKTSMCLGKGSANVINSYYSKAQSEDTYCVAMQSRLLHPLIWFVRLVGCRRCQLNHNCAQQPITLVTVLTFSSTTTKVKIEGSRFSRPLTISSHGFHTTATWRSTFDPKSAVEVTETPPEPFLLSTMVLAYTGMFFA